MAFRLSGREVFLSAPRQGVAVYAGSYYTRATGVELVSYSWLLSRSDTCDLGQRRHSSDNGRTWKLLEEVPMGEERPGGMLRRHWKGGYVDPRTGRSLYFWMEGLLPTDHPHEGLKRWQMNYSVSEDGGLSNKHSGLVIHEGAEYSAEHQLPGVWLGKNCVMMGDLTCAAITREDGAILVPVQTTPIGPNGEYHNPGGGYTYHDCAVLIGKWKKDGSLSWGMSEWVEGDASRSTRGVVEPTIARLADGRLLMVMRGSNGGSKDPEGKLPGYRWRCFSSDGGQTWGRPEPWTYTDGSNFFSPSSCSQLLHYSDGRLFWLGNISDKNPWANSPRYPMYIGEVDAASGLLKRETLLAIDTRQEGEGEDLFLSNFHAREDRETGEVLLHMSRVFSNNISGQKKDWSSDSLLYRLAVK